MMRVVSMFQRLHGPASARFAHHIAFYPGCYFKYVDDEAVTTRPIRIFHGTADDWTPIEPCRALSSGCVAPGRTCRSPSTPALTTGSIARVPRRRSTCRGRRRPATASGRSVRRATS